ncbi:MULTISPECIES: LCP family protein [unclassified Frigoribacterium]|uniref:LCP family protein n=1 Tax=unclassified Frigoribacterium TaxID=2627005 RepID=UPI0006FF1150|nr:MULTISPECIES: LCP family protein [unclassified Frigoribacterium]KQO46590.1 transcriptional regulator [Frigoribacterium sp. Leaf254]KQT38683.1 transcriptional regulator [Frigoribacterium sp. Leaf415]
MSTSLPVRHPDVTSEPFMTKRAWVLVLLNVVVPGSAQVLAGSRRLGRWGLASTLVFWAVAVVVVVLAFAFRSPLIEIATNVVALTVVQLFLAYYAVLWVVLTVDTLRLARIVRTAPSARGVLAGAMVLLMVVTVGPAAYGAYLAGVQHGLLDSLFTSRADAAPPVDGRYNIMLLGGDAGADRTGLRPDSISVASIDAETGATTIVGIPRNLYDAPFVAGSPLYGDYPDGYDCGDDCLVSFLYTYGEEHPDLYPDAESKGSNPGVEAMRDAVEGITGLTVQYYALIDMQGFVDLIDALGGIQVDVQQRIPINGGVDRNGQPINVDGWIEPGEQKLDGYHALWYARARHGTSDYDRMARQREVQQALLSQFQPATVLSKFQAVASAGVQTVDTDIPQGALAAFVDLAAKAKSQQITSLELVPPTYDNVYPDYDAMRAAVAQATTSATAP